MTTVKINKFLQEIENNVIGQNMKAIVFARNLLKSLLDGHNCKVMHQGSPLAHEIRRRGPF